MIRTDGRPTIAWSDGPEDAKQLVRQLEKHPVVLRYLSASAQVGPAERPTPIETAVAAGEPTTDPRED